MHLSRIPPIVAALILAGCISQSPLETSSTPSSDPYANHKSPPALFGAAKEEASDRIKITTPGNNDWADHRIRVTTCSQAVANAAGEGAVIRMGTASPYVNDPAATTSAALNARNDAGTSCGGGIQAAFVTESTPMVGAQTVQFCNDSSLQQAATEVVVAITRVSTGDLVKEYTFATIASC